jgi:hypothetical protein
MPLCRLRQATEAAVARLRQQIELETRRAELQAKTICTFIGASAGLWMDLKGGEKNPIVAAAQEIDFMPSPGALSKLGELDKLRGEKVADDWHDDPRLAPQPAGADKDASNADGSFEAFMNMFGGNAPLSAMNGGETP